MARKFARNELHRESLEYNEERYCNQLLCLKDEMLKRICEEWYSAAPNVLEELYNSMPRRIADLIEAKENATKY